MPELLIRVKTRPTGYLIANIFLVGGETSAFLITDILNETPETKTIGFCTRDKSDGFSFKHFGPSSLMFVGWRRLVLFDLTHLT